MSNPKAQFQLNNGNGWQTIAEVDIIDGVVNPPSAWTAARVLHKQIVYVGSTPIKTTVVPSDDTPRDTHFSGFAVALFQEMQADLTALYVALGSRRERDIASAEQIIQQRLARRTYDLVAHILLSAPTSALEHCHSAYEAGWNIQSIPDLPELPTEEGEE